ncbi:MAG: Stp1/IreP family PP2C-type Ser/Thr phosphatase [Bacilli bacterium]|nr:Stp1/IreP family PP2C-type Ser/Thr phosphatase [Bacilli bacterium]
MQYAYLTDTGKVRERNEDSVAIVKNKAGETLMLVADGMGGHKDGEVASSIAVSLISERFENIDSIGSKEDAITWLQTIVSEANVEIFNYVQDNPESEGMGTTLVLAVLTPSFLLFGNIGDSSGYVMKNGLLHKITVDHSLVNLLVSTGELTEEEAKDHPRKNVLMRALGANTEVEMDIFNVELTIDGIMLCSDGLTNMLDDEQIARVLNEDIDLEQRLAKLIFKCNNRGGNDNISVAYLIKEDN